MRVGGVRFIPIDVRVIVATNKDLFGLVQQAAFRDDLFHRPAQALFEPAYPLLICLTGRASMYPR